MDISGIMNNTIKLKNYIENTSRLYDNALESKNTLLGKINNDTKEINLLENTREVFKVLENKLSEANIKHVEALCNQALQTVFDTDTVKYQIKIETLVQRNNNQVQFYLFEKDLTTGEEVKTRIEDNGFGIQSLIGLVLQIYFILIHNQQHILFLDESLTAISVDKLPKLKVFLNEVSNKLDFKFVLIAHVESLFTLADYRYNVVNGNIKEIEVTND
jgi:hypothetical protein